MLKNFHVNLNTPFERIGSIRVFDLSKRQIDPITIITIFIVFLWIIPVDFEALIGPILDLRNVAYFIVLFSMLPFLAIIISEMHKVSKIILILFVAYFIFEAFLYYHQTGKFKSMYYAIWMCLSISTIFYVGSSSSRISLLFKAVILYIAFSAIYGLLMIFIGEPFIGFRNRLIGMPANQIMASNVYGFIREQDINRLVGFSKSIFAFGYQLCILFIGSYALVQYSKTKKGKYFWSIVLITAAIAIFANGERSAALSSLLGILFLIFVESKKYRSSLSRALFSGFLIMIIVYVTITPIPKKRISLPSRVEETRPSEVKARFYQQVAGMKTIMISPLGPSKKSYLGIARSYDAVRSHYGRKITAPHNHFINVGFRSGWVGIFLMFLIFINIKKCVTVFRFKANHMEDRFIWIYYGIVVSFAANLLNSCFHNTGLFFAEPGGMLMLGLIGAGASLTTKQFHFNSAS